MTTAHLPLSGTGAGKRTGTRSFGANYSQVTWKEERTESKNLGDCHGKTEKEEC